MRRLILTIMLVMALLALLIGAAQAVSHARPASESLQVLRLTDCALPCWLGIMPGRTTLGEAADILSEAFPANAVVAVNRESIVMTYDDGPNRFIAVISTRLYVVSQVTIRTSEMRSFMLADVITHYGDPTCYQGSAAWRSGAIYRSPDAIARVAGNAPRRGWRQTVNGISMYSTRFVRRRYNPCRFVEDAPGQ